MAAFFETVTPAEAKDWCARELAIGRLIEADSEMWDGRLRRSFATEETPEASGSLPDPASRMRLLSPFDPLRRDRARAQRLSGFHFRIEIFVPKARRKYGYYVFPALQGDRVIGRLDARRVDGALSVRAFWPESGICMGKARTAALLAEPERVNGLAGVESVGLGAAWVHASPAP